MGRGWNGGFIDALGISGDRSGLLVLESCFHLGEVVASDIIHQCLGYHSYGRFVPME